jgi:hypothetical protein
MVGDSDAMGIAAQIVENVFCSAKRWLGIDDPVVPEQLPKEAGEATRRGQNLLRAVKLKLALREELLESRDELAAEDSTAVQAKPFFVLMHRIGDGKVMWQHATRLSLKMKNVLVQRLREADGRNSYKLFMANDSVFLKGPTIGPYNGYCVPRADEQMTKAEAIWSDGQDVLSLYGAVVVADLR